MNFEATGLNGSYVIDIFPIEDERGWFVRTFCKNEFDNIGHRGEWVQMNHSFTYKEGTIKKNAFSKTSIC